MARQHQGQRLHGGSGKVLVRDLLKRRQRDDVRSITTELLLDGADDDHIADSLAGFVELSDESIERAIVQIREVCRKALIDPEGWTPRARGSGADGGS